MKALVTGATGFTGGYMVKNLLDHGYQVRAFVRPESDLSQLKQWPVEFAFGSLENQNEVEQAVNGVDIVFHIAALYRAANVPDSVYHQVNVEGTRYILQASQTFNVKRVVHCSTCGVHGDIKNPPADETHPVEPEDIYQETKAKAEELALSYHKEQGLPVTVVRPVGIYGPGDTRMLKMYRMVGNRKFIMFGGGNVYYHLTFVTDTVEGFRLAGESDQAVGQVYIIAGESYTTLNEFAALIADELNVKPPKFRPPVWPLYVVAFLCEKICIPLRIEPPIFRRRAHIFTHDRAFDISKAKQELGFHPKVNMKEGIHRTAEWYKQKGYLKGDL
ncbi:MAG: NAD-dependent epimerase/dehydratase family protein [candidate division KSB1 bacterium]|nr:NAD-dependent epimerase/dehydratase family protein [candidate division KSB1 bacterium]